MNKYWPLVPLTKSKYFPTDIKRICFGKKKQLIIGSQMFNKTEEPVLAGRIKLIFSPFIVVGIVINGFIVFKIAKKHWHNLLPVHVYQVNFFSGLFLLTFSAMMTAILVGEDSFICSSVFFINFLPEKTLFLTLLSYNLTVF